MWCPPEITKDKIMMKKCNMSEYPMRDWDKFRKVGSDHMLLFAIRDWKVKELFYV